MAVRYTGIAVSPGVAAGKIWVYAPFAPQAERGMTDDRGQEERQFTAARERAAEELSSLSLRVEARGEEEKAALFSAQREILLDEELEEEIRAAIRDGNNGPWAIQSACGRYAALLEEMDDPVLRERAADLRDVCRRLLRCWAGAPERDLSLLEEPVILAARELLPSEMAELDREKVRGIVTELGGTTCHTAILARKEGIPAVLGVAGLLSGLTDGTQILLDGGEGIVVTCPTPEEREEWLHRAQRAEREQSLVRGYLDAEPVTADGARVEVALNLTRADDRELEALRHTDGVGLFRTEFLFLGRAVPPSEEEQYRIYRKVLRACGGRPVVLRTLDAGDDKPLKYMASDGEKRGLALCLDHPEVFRTQLRAALRASVYGELRIMFPMVADLEEFRRGKVLLEEAKGALAREGVPFVRDVKVGLMVETPSLAQMAEQAAVEADFASIGTNDLTQFLVGTSRREADGQSFHPELFRLVGEVVRAFDRQGKPVAVCGELAGQELGAAVLLGLGVRRLSMNGTAVPGIKKLIRRLDSGQARKLARRICSMSAAGEVWESLTEQLRL